MLRKSFNATAAAAAIALSLTACGGGGGGTSALPSTGAPTTGNPTQNQSAKASMTIKIPAKAVTSSSRSQYISASTQSMTIGIVSNGKTTQLAEVDLTASSNSCTALAGGGLQCNVVFVGQAGKNVYALSMYDQTGGKGNVLSTGSLEAELVAGQNTNIPVTLDGVAATVTAALSPSTLPVGSVGSAVVVVEARDAQNNVIVGPGGFASPITLSISGDTYGTLSLTTTPSGSNSAQTAKQSVTVTSPGQLVTLNYNGATNVASTITPSIGSKAGNAATFSGSGAAATQIATSLVSQNGLQSYFFPADITALPNATAAVVLQGQQCCWSNPEMLGLVTLNGYQKYFVPDTTDPYNPGTYTSPFVGEPTAVVVHGLSANISTEAGEQYHSLTSDKNGNIVYGASFSSTAANNNCGGGGGTLNSGVLGVLNPSNNTTTEHVLKGTPWVFQTDTSGNVWFIEASGTCNGTSLSPSGYAIGELSATGTITETDFATAGITWSSYPTAMSIEPDGKAMFIADSDASKIVKVTLPSMSAATTAAVTNTNDAYALATAPDGTTLWMTGNETSNGSYYYGYIPGSTTFGDAGVHEALFPVPYFYGYDAVYADGSIWGAGYDDYGLGRFTFSSTGALSTTFLSTQKPYYVEPWSLSAGSGYIWATDDDYDSIVAIQYGSPSSVTTPLMMRQVGSVQLVPQASRVHHVSRKHR